MPELPEVETVRRTLKNFIIGTKIESLEVLYPRIIEDDIKEFKDKVEGQTINDIDRDGKYLIFILDDVAFVSHLRMEGKYNLKDKNEEYNKHDHIIFHLNNGQELRYNDTRKFGRMKLVDKDNYRSNPPLAKLGPEPFQATVEKLYPKFQKTKHPIKDVLLDQTVIAGIGNIYANEICFSMRISPFTPANTLTKPQIKKLIQISSDTLNEAISQGGTTIHSFSSNGIDGLFQVKLKVHLQKKCKVCGGEIIKGKINGRSTYYCPKCQKVKK
ncbi:MAG: DNA-formamidopyrimidine glycosylase [Thomasclavelia sp.]|jgi:formamidopyrimidine-DNA glycosylase|nr:DNA-formamidopyrimidine glycosylase [Thomasclavelia sp.]